MIAMMGTITIDGVRGQPLVQQRQQICCVTIASAIQTAVAFWCVLQIQTPQLRLLLSKYHQKKVSHRTSTLSVTLSANPAIQEY